MKILERNPGLDPMQLGVANSASTSIVTKCLFDATDEKDWELSKYQKGFGCGRQFFIGTQNADALT